MNDLDHRLHELAAAVPLPEVPVEEDLARGQRRLRLHRILTTAGAVAGVAVIALGVGVARGSVDNSRGVQPAGTATQSARPTPTPEPTAIPTSQGSMRPKIVDDRTGGELLRDYRDVLAEHLDPDGTHLQQKPDNLQSGGGLGTKLAWTMPGQDGLGMVQIFVGRGWNSFVGATCGSGAECDDVRVDGINAQVVEWNGATSVVVRRAGGTVAITVDALFGNNSLVPVEGMDIAMDDLVRAAADERLIQATPRQQRNAGTSMGFPDLP